MFEICVLFLKLGITGFGGPLALVAMIEQSVCHERKWFTSNEFSQIFSVCKLLPGPLAVQMAICSGYRYKGRIGGIIAGVSFLLPSILIMTIISIIYSKYGLINLPQVNLILKFIQDITIAIIIKATIDLAKNYFVPVDMRHNEIYLQLILLIISAIIIFYIPTFEPLIILSCGFAGLIITKFLSNTTKSNGSYLLVTFTKPLFSTPVIIIGSIMLTLCQLFLISFKAGEFSFGTGLAIIPLLHGDLVNKTHWLTNQQFLDGVSFGQITPGPTTVSVVFFGYQIAKLSGMLVSTLGFYLPGFINTLIILPLIWNWINKTNKLQIFFRWAFPAVIGGIISASIKIGLSAITKWFDPLITVIGLFIIVRKLLPIWLLIPIAGLCGLICYYFPIF